MINREAIKNMVNRYPGTEQDKTTIEKLLLVSFSQPISDVEKGIKQIKKIRIG